MITNTNNTKKNYSPNLKFLIVIDLLIDDLIGDVFASENPSYQKFVCSSKQAKFLVRFFIVLIALCRKLQETLTSLKSILSKTIQDDQKIIEDHTYFLIPRLLVKITLSYLRIFGVFTHVTQNL